MATERSTLRQRSSAWFALGLVPFILLATLNAGGYRYGASDQAFYQPAVLAKLNPALFPRDTALIAAQATLTKYDDVIAAIVRVSGLSLPIVFLILYVTSLVLVALGAWQVGRSLFRGQMAVFALLFAMTLRHAVAQTGTNTLEGYFHPRQLAFGLGLIAVAAFLRGRLAVTALLVLAAGALHPTAALWFGVWLAMAAAVLRADVRRGLLIAAVPAAAAAIWALTAGPLSGRLGPMDPEWTRMLGSKEYLFPLQWPAYVWLMNLGYIAVVLVIHRMRQRAGVVTALERSLVLGSLSLVAVFAVALVAQALRIALAFQLQPARLFLMFDFLATVYVVWAVVDRAGSAWRPRLATGLIIAFAVCRGLYVLASGRPVMELDVRDNDWGRVMAWARTTDVRSGWLADPLHASVYGTSVRVAGERDVFVEATKDAALGIYDRDIARRADERYRMIEQFHLLSAETVRGIAAQYDLDYFVTEQTLPLPVAFQSGAIRVYRLR